MKTPLEVNEFVKSHALGNDYIVLDEAKLSRPLTPEAVRRICDIHYGIGSDGILLVSAKAGVGADFGVRIFNPDGGEAEKSGNGLRILAKFLHDHGYTGKPEFRVSTPGGTVGARLHLAGGRVNGMDANKIDLDHPLSGILLDHKVGDIVTLTIMRSNKQMQIQVTLGTHPSS